jgi:hypothetical protein
MDKNTFFCFFRVTKVLIWYKCQITNIKTTTMKKVFSLIAVALVATMVACGPSAEEKAKIEADLKAKADSITKSLEQAVNDASAPADTTAAPADSAHAESH